MDARRITPAASPVADKVFKIDPISGRYVGYKEFTPNSVVLAPHQFLDQKYTDVLPTNVAQSMARSIWTAQRHQRVSAFSCSVLGQWVHCHTVMHDALAHIQVTVRKTIHRNLVVMLLASAIA
jgi:hypothetical protein